MFTNFQLPETLSTSQEKDVSFLYLCIFYCMMEIARHTVEIENLEEAKEELEPYCEHCGSGDDPTRYDEDIEDLGGRKEDAQDFIEYCDQYIQDTPFGLAAEYCDSPEDFFMSHSISTGTTNAEHVIPAMMNILENTDEFEALETELEAIDDKYAAIKDEVEDNMHTHPDEVLSGYYEALTEFAVELMDLINDKYCPENYVFGYHESNGSDLGFHYQSKAHMERRGYGSIFVSIPELNYIHEYSDVLESIHCINAINNEDQRYIVLHAVNLRLNTVRYLIVDSEDMKILDAYTVKRSAIERVRLYNEGTVKPVIQRYQYGFRVKQEPYEGCTYNMVTHYIEDIKTGLLTESGKTIGRGTKHTLDVNREVYAEIETMNNLYAEM